MFLRPGGNLTDGGAKTRDFLAILLDWFLLIVQQTIYVGLQDPRTSPHPTNSKQNTQAHAHLLLITGIPVFPTHVQMHLKSWGRTKSKHTPIE